MGINSKILIFLVILHSSLSAPEWRNIRIHADVSRLEKLSSVKNGSKIYNGLVNIIIPGMLKHLEDSIQVKSELSMSIKAQGCEAIKDIGIYLNKEIQADLVIFFVFSETNDGTVASAIDCHRDPSNNRPIAGIVDLNVNAMGDVSEAYRNAHIATTIHEVYHILGFTSDFYDKFIDSNGNVIAKSNVVKAVTSGKFSQMIVTPKVLAWAKTYYGCSTMDGVPLENNGDAGTAASHWEKFIAASDVMGPVDFTEVTLSGLTMSFLEDTGFYKLKWEMEENWEWGKGAGCAFITGDCNAHPQKCNKSTTPTLCSPEYASKGECSNGDHNPDCAFYESEPNKDCRFSQNKVTGDYVSLMTFTHEGRCLQSLLGTSSGKQPKETQNCLKMTCVNNVVKVKVGETEVTCDTEGKKDIDAAVGSYVMCPNPTNFCTRESERCPEDCNGHGRCLKDKTCWCYPGFGGSSCKDAGPKYVYKSLFTVKEEISFGDIYVLSLWVTLGMLMTLSN